MILTAVQDSSTYSSYSSSAIGQIPKLGLGREPFKWAPGYCYDPWHVAALSL